MRKRASYEKKYGPTIGPKLLAHLQKEAAHAAAASRLKKKHAAAVELGALGGKARARSLDKKSLSAIGKKGARARWASKK